MGLRHYLAHARILANPWLLGRALRWPLPPARKGTPAEDNQSRHPVQPLLRRLWPRVAVVLIRLAQHLGPRVVKVRGHTFAVPRQVFNPKLYLTSKFMARHMEVRPGDDVLDVGTGSGVLAVVAGETARRVVAVDIDPVAVECARASVQRNGMEKVVRVAQSDLFAALPPDARFNIILFSPPYFEGAIRSAFDHALYDPQKALATRFFARAGRHLKPGGYVQMVYSSAAQPERALKAAGRLGWDWSVVAEKKAGLEVLYVYRLTLAPGREDAKAV
jgi:release factor glutamine methyltransferase